MPIPWQSAAAFLCITTNSRLPGDRYSIEQAVAIVDAWSADDGIWRRIARLGFREVYGTSVGESAGLNRALAERVEQWLRPGSRAGAAVSGEGHAQVWELFYGIARRNFGLAWI